jgi:23S rRNA (adenine2503-C2)-methyltransferase
MRILAAVGSDDIARAYVAETEAGRLVEFTEAVQPPLPREEKWVLVISTLFGCPFRCVMCDAGGGYGGKLSFDELVGQVDFLVDRRYPDRRVPSRKFKIQFARVGEPSLNPAVIDALEALPMRYAAPGLMPSLSTIAPAGCEDFMEALLDVKERFYRGRFQLQFSIHTTDRELRDTLIPARKWDFARIAEYGHRFKSSADRKVTLNFALAKGMPIDPAVMIKHFDPDHFMVKITPVNPTHAAVGNGIISLVTPGGDAAARERERLEAEGYDVLLSIGELEENRIGSNCGQFIQRHWERSVSGGAAGRGDSYARVGDETNNGSESV